MTQSIETLKKLTQTTFDSAEGYRKAAEKAESKAIKRALEQRAERRSLTLEKLNNGLRAKDETPITSVSMAGSAHQKFMAIADAFSDGDKVAIKRVDEGEEYIAELFRETLNADDIQDMDLGVRTMLQDAYVEISKGERFANMLEEQYA